MAIIKKFGKLMKKRENGRTLGQGMVEFSIILPIVLTSFFTIIELARLYHAWVAVENGARFGVRYAITGELDTTNCSGGTCTNEAEEDAARVATIKDVIWGGSESILRKDEGIGINSDSGFFNTTICDPDNLVGPASQYDTYTCTNGEDAGEPGDQVVVIVEYNHPIIVPIISNIIPQIRLTAERQSIVETFRVVKSDSAPGYSPPPPPPAMTPPPTSTPAPTESAAYDYCANIVYDGDNEYADVIFWDQSETYDKMWKFAFLVFNNNEMSMYLTDYFVDWTGDVDLLYIRYGSDCPPSWCSYKLSAKNIANGPVYCWTSTSKTRHCGSNSNVEFVSRPGCPSDCYPTEIYNMFCGDGGPCTYNEPWSSNANPVITGSSYTFEAQATWTFYASDTGEAEDIECVKTWDVSGNAKDHSGGGSSSWPDPTPASSEGGGGGGGGGGSPTPDPSSPDD